MGKGTQEPRGWNRTWYLGMQGWEREHRSPMAGTGPNPDLQSADPSPWDEDPRLFPQPPRSRDAPNTSGRGAEPGTGGRRGILPFSKPNSFQEQLFHGKHSPDPTPGTAQTAGSSSRAAPAFPGPSQPGCVREVARKGLKNVPQVPPVPPPDPAQGPLVQFRGQGHGHSEGREHLHSLWIFAVIPKGKA